jgi:hypothetical protein
VTVKTLEKYVIKAAKQGIKIRIKQSGYNLCVFLVLFLKKQRKTL